MLRQILLKNTYIHVSICCKQLKLLNNFAAGCADDRYIKPNNRVGTASQIFKNVKSLHCRSEDKIKLVSSTPFKGICFILI